MSPRSWNEIWDHRDAPGRTGSLLRQLLDGGGMDSGFAHVDEPAWCQFVKQISTALSLQPGASVFEVGCGAGAFLLRLLDDGMSVAGLDRSPSLVSVAARALPAGAFEVRDASELPVRPQFDAVISMGVFLYFPSLEYAERVIDRMVGKARGAVAILDLPDAALRTEALRERERRAGGHAAYAERYEGLEHCFYPRRWVAEALERNGLVGVHVEDQSLTGYGNAPWRFNAWGFLDR